MKNLQVEIKEAHLRLAFTTLTADFDYCGYSVIKSTDMVLVSTGIKDFPCAIVTNNTIYLNEAFEELPEVHQQAILSHELGHLKLNHLEKLSNGEDRMVLEKEADNFAKEQGNDILGALEYFLEHYAKQPHHILELTTRIRALKNSEPTMQDPFNLGNICKILLKPFNIKGN